VLSFISFYYSYCCYTSTFLIFESLFSFLSHDLFAKLNVYAARTFVNLESAYLKEFAYKVLLLFIFYFDKFTVWLRKDVLFEFDIVILFVVWYFSSYFLFFILYCLSFIYDIYFSFIFYGLT
jgi:hypothetical protein